MVCAGDDHDLMNWGLKRWQTTCYTTATLIPRVSHQKQQYLVEETKDLSCNVFPSCFLVIHDTGTGSQDNVTELTRWQQLDNPLLKITKLNVVTRRDDTSLVESAVELNNDLAVSVVIDFFEFANIA